MFTKNNGLLGMYQSDPPAAQDSNLAPREEIINEVIDQVNREISVRVLQSPTEEERQRVQEQINSLVGMALRRRGLSSGFQLDTALAAEVGRRLMGLGFLDLLLPPARNDLSEIAVNSDGTIWVMKKGSVRWEPVSNLHPEPPEIYRVLDRILGPQNKTLNETNPSINAKLPPTPYNPGGGRVKALHPVIAPKGDNPSINIRLFEPKPVLPGWILERGVMSEPMMDILSLAMQQGLRILITGSTRTGKTTLLSALCNFLPEWWRIVKIEDPQEIWVDHPNVQTIEVRTAAIGTEVRTYTLSDGVDDSLRMSPDYLIVGEVREGHAAQGLFRALMTGHSGACTFHADTPVEAARRLANIMGADANVDPLHAAQTIADAIDLVVQIGIRDEIRRVVLIANVVKELQNGQVAFDPIYFFDQRSPVSAPQWLQVGKLSQRVTAEMSLADMIGSEFRINENLSV